MTTSDLANHLTLVAFTAITLLSSCSSEPETPEVSLELVGLDGSERTLSWNDLTTMPAAEGIGGILNTVGTITPVARYTGVTLEDLTDQVGGLTERGGLQIVASDAYLVTLSASQVLQGRVVTFDAESGDPITLEEAPRAVLAYEREGARISEQDGGPLRICFLTSDEAQVTEGHLWVKSVVRLAIVPSEPEWTLRLVGARNETLTRSLFETGAAPGCHEARWADDEGRMWTGIPLWLLVGWVDDENVHRPGAFNRELAAAGYEIELVSSSGERRSLASDLVSADDNIIVAHRVDDEPLAPSTGPLALVGASLAPEEHLPGLQEIVLHLP